MKQVYMVESYGTNGNKFKLKLLLDIGRDYTDADKQNIEKCCEDLQTAIRRESVRLDPKIKERAKEERMSIQDAFDGEALFMEAIPNEYWPDSYGYATTLPWFMVTTKLGRIKMGWRKHVLSIDWKDSMIEKEAKDLFPDEDVTKYDKCIHAWGYKKAKEYIKVLLSAK